MDMETEPTGLSGPGDSAPGPATTPSHGPSLRNLLLSLPLLFASLLPYVALAGLLRAELQWSLLLLGALGWWLALLLRLPVILLVKQKSLAQAQKAIVLSSGPAEELVRLGLLLWLGLDFTTAFSVALGWAGIEILYAMVQGFALISLARRQDKMAEEARTLLRLQGMDQALTASGPFWGVCERLSANAIHLALTLLLLVSPWMVLLTAALHSGVNLTFTWVLRHSLPAAQLALASLAALLLLLSLLLVP